MKGSRTWQPVGAIQKMRHDPKQTGHGGHDGATRQHPGPVTLVTEWGQEDDGGDTANVRCR